ncbi:MAG: hypothetical protein H7831_12860 [Magnetococcus sp. WYHC-3]
MPNSNNRKPLRLALAAAAVLAVAAAWMAYFLPNSRVPVAPTAVAPVAPTTAPVATRPVPAVEAPEAAKPSLSLDQMKEEFAELMKKRSGLLSKCKESQKLIVASRVTTDRSGPANSATAEAYRQKVLEMERALNNHPRVLAIQAMYDVAQTDKVAVSYQQGKIVSGWRVAKEARKAREQEVSVAMAERSEALRHELLKNAGVNDIRKLPEEAQQRLRNDGIQTTNTVAALKKTYLEESSTNAEMQARIQDGSLQRFETLNARYQELEKQQDDIRQQIQKLRDELRRSDDPVIAPLQQEVLAASQRHLAAMAAQPEVAAAHKFLDDLDTMRAEIDQRARVLRKAILAAEPAYKPTLDQQSAVGGLALVGEDFWMIAG